MDKEMQYMPEVDYATIGKLAALWILLKIIF